MLARYDDSNVCNPCSRHDYFVARPETGDVEMNGARGGAREGAGRKRTAPEGTTRGSHTLRASASEWEIIKDFARILKHQPERAEKMVRELKELES
jgi:hypothetical protein